MNVYRWTFFFTKKKINFYIYLKVFVVVYEVMARTKQTARKSTEPLKAKKVRKVVNPAYTSNVKGAENDDEPGVESDEESGVESDEESGVESDEEPAVEPKVFKCQTPPPEGDVWKCQTPVVESAGVVLMDVWKCERYKKYRYDPMAKVPMKGENVKPFLYGRVVVLQLKGNSGSVVG